VRNKYLILITESYPYGAVAESFLDKEILYLSKSFNSIIIIPCNLPPEIERVERALPKNIAVDSSLLKFLQKKKNILLNLFRGIAKFYINFKEIINKPKIFFDFRALMRMLYYFYRALLIEKWVLNYIKNTDIDLKNTIFYTYWLSPATMGINTAKRKCKLIKIISRAHGGDLYEERHYSDYLPFRYETMNIDHLFPISMHGLNYIRNRYPFLKAKCTLSYLGVENPGFISQTSSDNTFRLVTCSYVVPVKRIHLIIYALKIIGIKRHEIKIEWTHIGYGPLFQQMKELADELLPKDILYNFLGFLPTNEVYLYYKNKPIDVFLNVSASEGLPVSIMEAQSCGIPVIATAVGGTPEIVNEKVGILLSPNPTPEEIGSAIEYLIDNSEIAKQMRYSSIKNWEERFNACKNFSEFINIIKKI
jgi:glycosyltransferase involved in cell wall biosynthesis